MRSKVTISKWLIFFALLAITQEVSGQPPFGQIRCKVFGDGQALAYATVALPALGRGTLTDTLGQATLDNLPLESSYEVEVSFVGYFSQKKKVQLSENGGATLLFELSPRSLEEVVVTGSMRETKRSKSTIPVEVISAKLFSRNPTPNLFEAVSLLSGVQPVMNCNVCNTGDIQINGIEGVYTQVLLDGMPIVSGLGTVYGLMGIPNGLVDRIEIVKGPAATLYGSEAMGGQINIITKDALTAPRLSADIFGSSWGELNLDGGLAYQLGKSTTGLLGVHGFWVDHPVDNNEDGFTDLAQQKRLSLFKKLQWKAHEDRVGQFAARYVWEDRWGGQTHWTPAHRGSSQIYGESIYTNRIELLASYPLPVSLPVYLQGSYNFHHQDSYYGDTPYNARQNIGFLQAYLDKKIAKHHLLAGAAVRYTFYDDNTPATEAESRTILPGIFLQHERELGEKSHVLSGMRFDWHPAHGAVWSPRLGLRHHLNDRQSLRFGAGSGFRVVSLFTEDHAALSGAREVVIRENLQPERSWSGNLNYNLEVYHSSYFFNLDAALFYTHFSNRILPDYDTNPEQIIYANLDGSATTRGITLQGNYSDGLPLRLNLGITYMSVFTKSAEANKIPQIRAPNWSGTFLANYTHPRSRLSIDVTGNWSGPQRLPTVPNDFRPEYSPWFAILNLQLSRKFKHGITWYGGIKNILNFVPEHPILRPFDPFDTMTADPINNPNGYTFDPSYNYASLQGIRGFMGLRWELF